MDTEDGVVEHHGVVLANLHVPLQVTADCSDDERLAGPDGEERILKVVFADSLSLNQPEDLLDLNRDGEAFLFRFDLRSAKDQPL